MKVRTAIATTLADSEKILLSFVTYHLHIGFDHIYLFFDRPDDPAAELVKDFPKVTVIKNNQYLESLWQQTKLYQTNETCRHYVNVEVMARQMLNMSVACDLAKKAGIDFILHIDIDELFYSPRQTVAEHFEELYKYNVSSLQYKVYEAVPHQLRIDDYFKEVTIFRKHWDHHSFSQQRARKQCGHEFKFYETGKTAALVRKIDIPLIHSVVLNDESNDIRSLLYEYKSRVRDSLFQFRSSDKVPCPIILHYPICGFEHFKNKYNTLGKFEDKAFAQGVVSGGQRPKIDVSYLDKKIEKNKRASGQLRLQRAFTERDRLDFHKLSRDVVQKGEQESIAFFEANVMASSEKIEMMLARNYLININEPSEILTKKELSRRVEMVREFPSGNWMH